MPTHSLQGHGDFTENTYTSNFAFDLSADIILFDDGGIKLKMLVHNDKDLIKGSLGSDTSFCSQDHINRLAFAYTKGSSNILLGMPNEVDIIRVRDQMNTCHYDVLQPSEEQREQYR